MSDQLTTAESLDACETMLARITGDKPPPLDSWTPREWARLQWEFSELRAAEGRAADRERKILAKCRAALQAERDYQYANTQRVKSKYGAQRRDREVESARARRDALARELGL